jgi:hypothetical protein
VAGFKKNYLLYYTDDNYFPKYCKETWDMLQFHVPFRSSSFNLETEIVRIIHVYHESYVCWIFISFSNAYTFFLFCCSKTKSDNTQCFLINFHQDENVISINMQYSESDSDFTNNYNLYKRIDAIRVIMHIYILYYISVKFDGKFRSQINNYFFYLSLNSFVILIDTYILNVCFRS